MTLIWLAVALVASAATARTDLTVDAVTRATTLNPVTGDISVLTDGDTPENDPMAGAVEFGGIGLLVAEWPEPVELATIRIHLGLMERYGVYAFQGGSTTETGQRVDVEDPAYTKEGLAPLESNIWFEIECRPDIAVDNLALSLVGTTVIYEIQFLGPARTAVEPASLGALKARISR